MIKLPEHIFIFITVIATVYSQIIMRWQISLAGSLPSDLSGILIFVFRQLTNMWVLSGLFATFIAGVSWMLTMTKFEISYAFPFMSLNYILVLIAGFVFFDESLTVSKIIAVSLIMLGVIVMARG